MSILMLQVVSAVDISAKLCFLEAIREGCRLPDSARPFRKAQNPSYSERLRWKRRRWNLYSLYTDSKYGCVRFQPQENDKSPILSSFVANTAGEVAISSEQKVYDVVLKQAALVKKQLRSNTALDVKPDLVIPGTTTLLTEAYDRCGEVCAEYAKTFYLGTLLMTPERRRAIWAIYVWCRRTDELVDGPNASHITPSALDRWEARLEDLFAGRPYDMFDAALSDTVSMFPVDIQA